LNTLFILLAGLLILIAFAFLLPPLLRKDPAANLDLSSNQNQRNVMIARQRLAELNEQKQSGVLSQALYDEQLAELEQTLSSDLYALEPPSLPAKSEGRWLAYVIMLALPLTAASLYWALGNVQAISDSEEMAKANPEVPNLADIHRMVNGLAEKLKTHPDDAQGWFMLGRSYLQLEQYPKAADALANAHRLLGDQPDVMLAYAQAIAFANGRNLTGKPAELINKVLTLEPNNMNALWLGGMLKIQQNDAPGAIQLWQKLETLLPPGSDAQKQMLAVLEKFSPLDSQQQAPSAPSQPAQPADASITVAVSLAPALLTSAEPDAVVFIYAQALSGPKMPLAIVRKKVSDLPATVTLNDSMAMMPDNKLSNFATVKLLARISKSGAAKAQAGDLIGSIESAGWSKNSKPYQIVIDQVIK
jgi:cytochrome c-type biogenesis protein CcmH